MQNSNGQNHPKYIYIGNLHKYGITKVLEKSIYGTQTAYRSRQFINFLFSLFIQGDCRLLLIISFHFSDHKYPQITEALDNRLFEQDNIKFNVLFLSAFHQQLINIILQNNNFQKILIF